MFSCLKEKPEATNYVNKNEKLNLIFKIFVDFFFLILILKVNWKECKMIYKFDKTLIRVWKCVYSYGKRWNGKLKEKQRKLKRHFHSNIIKSERYYKDFDFLFNWKEIDEIIVSLEI